jgi:hypothetical protein
MERRRFLQNVVAGGLATSAALGRQADADASRLPRIDSPGERKGDMLYRKLGHFGFSSFSSNQSNQVALSTEHLGFFDSRTTKLYDPPRSEGLA